MRVLKFEYSAWTENGEGGGDDKGGVSEAGEEGTVVDIIKLLGIRPFFLCVETSKRQLEGILYTGVTLADERGFEGRNTSLVGLDSNRCRELRLMDTAPLQRRISTGQFDKLSDERSNADVKGWLTSVKVRKDLTKSCCPNSGASSNVHHVVKILWDERSKV